MNNYLDNTKYLFAGTMAALCGGFLIADYLRKRDAKAGEHEDKPIVVASTSVPGLVTRGQEVYQSEMNQDMPGQADLNRINSVSIGAEDVRAESFDTQYVNMNPTDYQDQPF